MWRGRPQGRPLFSKNRYEAHKEGRFLAHASQALPGFSFFLLPKADIRHLLFYSLGES